MREGENLHGSAPSRTAPARTVLGSGTGNRTGRELRYLPRSSLCSQDPPSPLSARHKYTNLALAVAQAQQVQKITSGSPCRQSRTLPLAPLCQLSQETRVPNVQPPARLEKRHNVKAQTGESPHRQMQWVGPGSGEGLKATSHLLLHTRKQKSKRVIEFQSHPDAQSERLINNK